MSAVSNNTMTVNWSGPRRARKLRITLRAEGRTTRLTSGVVGRQSRQGRGQKGNRSTRRRELHGVEDRRRSYLRVSVRDSNWDCHRGSSVYGRRRSRRHHKGRWCKHGGWRSSGGMHNQISSRAFVAGLFRLRRMDAFRRGSDKMLQQLHHTLHRTRAGQWRGGSRRRQMVGVRCGRDRGGGGRRRSRSVCMGWHGSGSMSGWVDGSVDRNRNVGRDRLGDLGRDGVTVLARDEGPQGIICCIQTRGEGGHTVGQRRNIVGETVDLGHERGVGGARHLAPTDLFCPIRGPHPHPTRSWFRYPAPSPGSCNLNSGAAVTARAVSSIPADATAYPHRTHLWTIAFYAQSTTTSWPQTGTGYLNGMVVAMRLGTGGG
ncbi:hypothetical protein FB45DRAFT_860275 [Roridomyces roridus]|uniref:Uncharacterized protein n=1 Tax=Roridomyces roridus TaxID=1738132 RepID=A0AAD7FZP5_9AGAR|nr:hypothetical protein FB45DRAFT_860275 [Roridomyces roridus]